MQVFSSLSVFALIAIQTRFLSVEQYGVLAIFMLGVELVRGLSSQWINNSLIRLYPSSSEEDKKVIATNAYRLVWLLVFPSFCTLGLIIFAYDSFSTINFIALCALLLFKSNYQYFLELSRLNEYLNKYRLSSLSQSVSAVLISALLLSYQASLVMAISSLAISYLLGILISFNKKSLMKTNNSQISVILSYGLPFLFSGAIGVLNSRVDRFFIAEKIGMAEAGVYSAISNMLLGVTALMFMVVALPLYPELVKHTKNMSALRQKHTQYSNILFAITLPAMIGLCFIAKPLVSIFLTTEYLIYGVELFWLLAASVFILNIKSHFIDHGLQFMMKTRYLTITSAILIIINIALIFVFIGRFGVYGAAIAGITANSIALLLSLYFSFRFGYQHKFDSGFLKILFSSLIMAGALFLLHNFYQASNNIVLLVQSIIVGVLSYIFASLATNSLGIRKKLTEKYL